MNKNLAIVFGGGVMKGICHAGAHMALEELHIKPNIIVGTSAGSLFGAMAAAGMDHATVLKVINATDFRRELLDPASKWDHWKVHKDLNAIKKNLKGLLAVLCLTILTLGATPFFDHLPNWLRVVVIGLAITWVVICFRLYRLYSLCRTSAINPLYKGKKMSQWLNSILAEHLIKQGGMIADDIRANGGEVRFKHLKTDFAVVGTNLTQTRLRVFSSVLDPEFPVAKAVLASSSVPLFFPGIEDAESHILDGGFMSRLPIGVALDAGATEVIAFDLGSPCRFDISGWPGFIGAVYEAASDAQVSAYAKNPNVTVIDIDSSNIDPWQFDASEKEKINAMLDGYHKSLPRLQNLRLAGKI